MAITAAVEAISSVSGVQVLVAIIICIMNLMLIIKLRPLGTDRSNNMNIFS